MDACGKLVERALAPAGFATVLRLDLGVSRVDRGMVGVSPQETAAQLAVGKLVCDAAKMHVRLARRLFDCVVAHLRCWLAQSILFAACAQNLVMVPPHAVRAREGIGDVLQFFESCERRGVSCVEFSFGARALCDRRPRQDGADRHVRGVGKLLRGRRHRRCSLVVTRFQERFGELPERRGSLSRNACCLSELDTLLQFVDGRLLGTLKPC